MFDVDGGLLVDGDAPASPRVLPQYDNIFLSHDDRSRIVGDHAAGHEFGWKGMVLIDGFIDGAWRIRRERRHAIMTLELFAPVRGPLRVQVEEEAGRLFAFVAADADARDLRVIEDRG